MRNVFLVLSALLAVSSCTQDDYSEIVEDEKEDIVLSDKSEAKGKGIVIDGPDIGFDDDDDDPPVTSIDNPTVNN